MEIYKLWPKKQEEIINNICLLNNKSQTYLNPTAGSQSDLSICHLTIYFDYIWKVYKGTYGSDRSPILLENPRPNKENPTHWKLNKADWERFKEQCQKRLPQICYTIAQANYFTKTLIKIATDHMPKNSTKNNKADHGSITNAKKLSSWEKQLFINFSSMFQSLLLKVKGRKSLGCSDWTAGLFETWVALLYSLFDKYPWEMNWNPLFPPAMA